jgi:rod shape-determining protein MreC
VALSRRTGRGRYTLPVLILVAITVITLDYRNVAFIDTARDSTIDLLAPVTSTLKRVFRPVTNAWNGVFGYDELRSENERLRAELDEARGATLGAVDAERQRSELLALLNLDYLGDIPTVAARVVSGTPSNFDATIEIDRGLTAGIHEGMPVVTGAGLVGNVIRATDRRSVVRLITDPSFAVGVGSVVLTSGLEGSLYPAGIPVGEVRTVRHPAGSLQLDITVDPAADLDHLNFVKVVQWTPVPGA